MNHIKHSTNPAEIDKPVQIMFIDDDESCVILVEKIFKTYKWDYMSFTATSEALAAANSKKFDIIFSDANMPGIDGFKLADIIRNDPSNPNQRTPFIIVSGSAADEYTDERMNATAITELVSKPYSMEIFFELVARHVFPPR